MPRGFQKPFESSWGLQCPIKPTWTPKKINRKQNKDNQHPCGFRVGAVSLWKSRVSLNTPGLWPTFKRQEEPLDFWRFFISQVAEWVLFFTPNTSALQRRRDLVQTQHLQFWRNPPSLWKSLIKFSIPTCRCWRSAVSKDMQNIAFRSAGEKSSLESAVSTVHLPWY